MDGYISFTFPIITTNTIIEEIGEELFFILFDEYHDVSIKEKIVIILRYVDFKWHIIEQFLGIVYTIALSLKAAIEALFLSII